MPYYTTNDASSDDEHHHVHTPKKKSNGGTPGRHSGDKGRDLGDAAPSDSDASRAVTDHVQSVVNVYSQIAANPELQKLRTQERGLFDSLLQHAVPFALQAASSAVKALASGSAKRDIGEQLAIQQHLPTAINFANQVMAIPEVQENRGFFDKIFSIGMPIVLNTAQTLLGAKRGLESPADDDAQRGLFDAIIGKLPSTVFNVLSDVISGGNRDLGDSEDRGFLDILKKVAPVILNVASSAVNSLSGQRSLSFAPTDRGFFDSLKNVVSKVVSNPVVQKLGTTALNMGVKMATNALAGQRGVGEPEATPEYTESHVRGFFGSMLQSLTPIAMGALQGAVSSIGNRDIALPQKKSLFDVTAQLLPAVIQAAQTKFYQSKPGGASSAEEAAFLQTVLAQHAAAIVQAAKEQAGNPGSNAARGILGSILGSIIPF